MNVGVQVVDRRVRAQVYFQTGMFRGLNLKTVAGFVDLCPPGKCESDTEFNSAFENDNGSDQLMSCCFGIVSEIRSRPQCQSVGKRNESGLRQDLCNEHTGVWKIELMRFNRFVRSDCKVRAPSRIDDRVEQRRGVETGDTHPPNRSVASDEGGCCAVANQPMVFDRQITI